MFGNNDKVLFIFYKVTIVVLHSKSCELQESQIMAGEPPLVKDEHPWEFNPITVMRKRKT